MSYTDSIKYIGKYNKSRMSIGALDYSKSHMTEEVMKKFIQFMQCWGATLTKEG